MNKTLVGTVVVALVFLGGWYVWQRGDRIQFDPDRPYAISGEFGGESIPAEETVSLLDLMESGEDRRCLLKLNLGSADIEGVVYATPGRARGTFHAATASGVVTSHLLVRDNVTYSWVEGFKVGLSAPLEVSPRPSGAGGVDVRAKFKYVCEPWTVDEAIFRSPPEIDFNQRSE